MPESPEAPLALGTLRVTRNAFVRQLAVIFRSNHGTAIGGSEWRIESPSISLRDGGANTASRCATPFDVSLWGSRPIGRYAATDVSSAPAKIRTWAADRFRAIGSSVHPARVVEDRVTSIVIADAEPLQRKSSSSTKRRSIFLADAEMFSPEPETTVSGSMKGPECGADGSAGSPLPEIANR